MTNENKRDLEINVHENIGVSDLVCSVEVVKKYSKALQKFLIKYDELGKKFYRKLLWFFEKDIAVHFCLLNMYGWKNGKIIDLNEKKLTLVLKEFKEGELPFLLEEINIDTIKKFKEKDES